ncbi:MAG TPA: serine hydrolase domain-containing protein [Mobilitalea sp.]|nr:serine hydrolase domain-containing protein [Mobilitalea sp.]
MKKCISFLALFIIILLFNSGGANASAAIDLPSGIDSSELESTIDAYVTENEATTAAMSVAVYSGKDILFKKAYGYTDLESKIVNDDNSVFEWGSCTKLLVWTSIMQLYEQGELSLTEDIKNYLPDDFLTKLNYDEPITLIHLMNHTAGWEETITDLFLENENDIKELEEALRYIEPEQVHAPGEVTSYSNWSTALAGYIVERVSGEPFDAYVKEHIFTPLGMEHTALRPDLSDNSWVAEQRLKEKCYTADNQPLGNCFYYLSLYPAGMATGTLNDFVKFAQAFIPSAEGTTPLFEKADTLKEMLSSSGYYADNTTARNAHGFWTDYFSVPVLWHNGGTLGSTSWFTFQPETGLGVVILTNQSNESIYTCGLLSKIFGTYQYEPITDTVDISGMYMSSRTVYTGFGKLYHLFCLNQIDAMGSIYQSPTTGITYTGISKQSFLMNMGGRKQYIVYETKGDDGKSILQMPGKDYLEVSGYSILAELLLLILFFIAVLYSFVTLFVRIIRLVRYKKKLIHVGFLSAVDLSVIISMVLSVCLGMNLFSNGSMFSMVQWILVVIGFLALVPIAYTIYLILKFRQLNCAGRTKAGLIVHNVIGLIMTINVLYWNLYKFW